MDSIDIESDYLTFRNQVKETWGGLFDNQAALFFERAVYLAQNDLEFSGIVEAEFAYELSQYAKDNYTSVYIIGFLCEAYSAIDKINKAKEYYDLGMSLLDKEHPDYDRDKADFDRVKSIGNDWKGELDS